jgi:hypothetical protein
MAAKSVVPVAFGFAWALGIALGLSMGLEEFLEWRRRVSVQEEPIVTGTVIDRKPFSISNAKFVIRVAESDTVVHAYIRRQLINRVPDTVRFHYSGQPLSEVFLLDYEENPYWIFVFCWSGALLLIVMAFLRMLLLWRENEQLRQQLEELTKVKEPEHTDHNG